MSKKSIKDSKLVNQSKRDFKKSIKRIWIAVVCALPFLVLLGVGMGELGIPEWLMVIIDVIVGGFICLITYIIFDKRDSKKKAKELMDEEKDVFKD